MEVISKMNIQETLVENMLLKGVLVLILYGLVGFIQEVPSGAYLSHKLLCKVEYFKERSILMREKAFCLSLFLQNLH